MSTFTKNVFPFASLTIVCVTMAGNVLEFKYNVHVLVMLYTCYVVLYDECIPLITVFRLAGHGI